MGKECSWCVGSSINLIYNQTFKNMSILVVHYSFVLLFTVDLIICFIILSVLLLVLSHKYAYISENSHVDTRASQIQSLFPIFNQILFSFRCFLIADSNGKFRGKLGDKNNGEGREKNNETEINKFFSHFILCSIL